MNPNAGQQQPFSKFLPFLNNGQQVAIPSPTQAPVDTQPTQADSGGKENPLLDFLLPTAGAALGALVPGLGETGISEAGGAAAGQALSDFIQGKKPGADVAITGASSFLLPKILSPLFGGIANKAAGRAASLLGKPTDEIFNGVVAKDPWMTQNIGELQGAAKEFGLMDLPVKSSLNKMPQIFDDINSQISSSIAKNNTAIPLVAGEKSLLSNFTSQMEKSAYGPGDPGYDNGVNSILNKITSLGNGVADAKTIYGEKSAMGKVLSNTFDRQARGATLTPREEANMAYFQALKDSLDQFGSPEVRALNTKQNQLFDIAKAFGTQYAKTAGTKAAPFGFGNLLPFEGAGAGAGAGLLFHANPLLGAAIGFGGQAALNNPTAMEAASKGLGFLANPRLLASAGGGGAGVLNGILSPTLGGQQEQNNQGENSNALKNNGQNIPSFLNTGSNSANLSQTGSSVNSQNAVSTQFGTFPRQLPNPTSIANTIPGQPYPQSQYLADIQKATAMKTANPYNPGVQTQAQALIDQANANKAINDQFVQQYIQQQGLPADAQDFVRTAQPQWNSLTQLHDLLQTKGAQDLFQSFIQSDPLTQTLLAAKDPKYALMFNLLGQQKLAQARLAQGGVPRAYDLALSRLGSGQTAQANLAILDYAMNQFQTQYAQYAPAYGLSQGQVPNTVSGSSILNGILQQVAQ